MTDDRRGRPRGPNAPVLALAALERVRLLLRGGSVVDWFKLTFDDADDAKAFIRLNEGEPEDAADTARLAHLRAEAARYLQDEHGYKLAPELLACEPMDLFLYASERRGRRRDRFFACLLLKVMHVIQHIEARELRYRLPLSQQTISSLLIDKVDTFAASLREEGFPLVLYSGGAKTRTSTITKLLMKKEYHAATLHDRVRFRFVVERGADLVPLLHRMLVRLFPFNYVAPGQTQNDLVNFTALIESHAAYRDKASELQVELGREEQELRRGNEFSGPTYAVINFVVDMPIRVPRAVMEQARDVDGLGRVVFHLAEFQVVDQATADENERGENRHDRYKQRQLAIVRTRLERGKRGGPVDDE